MKYYKVVSFILLALFFLSMPRAIAQTKTLKKRIAVFDFEDKTKHRHRWWTGQPVGEGMADMLVTALVKSGNYSVLERQEMESLLEEQQLGLSGAVTQESAAQIGKLLGVEMAVFGAVTEFGYSEDQTGGRLKKQGFGIGIKKTSATVAVDVRFVNTSTGEILVADNVRKDEQKRGLMLDTKDFKFDNRDKFDDSIVGKATRDAIESIVDMIDQNAQNIPWQAKVIRGGADIYINAGALAGINNGDVFTVFRAGEELIDPDLGISLGSTETRLGKIRVVDNNIGNGKASKCVPVEGRGFDRNDLVRE